jgi:hypothetical protein
MTRPRTDPVAVPFHRRYLNLVNEIESRFAVARWKSADVEIWPLARMDLYLDMFWAHAGGAVRSRPLPVRVIERAATPLSNWWMRRRDPTHCVAHPRPAYASFLGDGASLDHVDGTWRDRYGEPVIAALEQRGLSTFLMQYGDPHTLPWHRPTFVANGIAAWGSLTRLATRIPIEMPEHDAVLQFLGRNGECAPSLSWNKLAARARGVFTTASAFERVLRIVRPKVAFVVAYYANLGPAYLLACRRQGILSVDLQHCPQEGAHKAYGWSTVPDRGYGVLPAIFWTWTEKDAAYIRSWTEQLAQPWHGSLYGGHTQLPSFLDDSNPLTKTWDAKFAALGNGKKFERDILVALQPIGGFRAGWDSLAAKIEAGPPQWRWWIRRHPAARAYQDVEYRRLVSLRLPNVQIEQSLSLPLPALLRNVSVLVSRFSGASAEAAQFGVPALFLSEEARGQFLEIIERGDAAVTTVEMLDSDIARLPRKPVRPAAIPRRDLDETLQKLEELARDYSRLWHGTPRSSE